MIAENKTPIISARPWWFIERFSLSGQNCRVKTQCPVQGACQKPVVYKATIKFDGIEKYTIQNPNFELIMLVTSSHNCLLALQSKKKCSENSVKLHFLHLMLFTIPILCNNIAVGKMLWSIFH